MSTNGTQAVMISASSASSSVTAWSMCHCGPVLILPSVPAMKGRMCWMGDSVISSPMMEPTPASSRFVKRKANISGSWAS